MKKSVVLLNIVAVLIMNYGCATTPPTLDPEVQQTYDKIHLFVEEIEATPELLMSDDDVIRKEAQDLSKLIQSLPTPSRYHMDELVAVFNILRNRINTSLKDSLKSISYDDASGMYNVDNIEANDIDVIGTYNVDIIATSYSFAERLWLYSLVALLNRGPNDPIAKYADSATKVKNGTGALLVMFTQKQYSPNYKNRLAAWKGIRSDPDTFASDSIYNLLAENAKLENNEEVKAVAEEALSEIKKELKKK